MHRAGIAAATVAMPLLLGAAAPQHGAPTGCTALAGWTERGVVTAVAHPSGPPPATPTPGGSGLPAGVVIPAHCELNGVLDKRRGIDGQFYAIRYRLRLPERWNGRFVFEGGGGTNGVVGAAIGQIGAGVVPALARGYAVVAQDSGHDNATNDDPARGGTAVFGGDPVARANYGGAALPRVAEIARAGITRFYGRGPAHGYFVGCSKGGQEGMAAAQRYPTLFDGIVAAAPGFSLPRAAIAQTADVQGFGALAGPAGLPPAARLGRLPSTFSPAQLARVRAAVLSACDALDGVADGIVGRFAQCTPMRMQPALASTTCPAGGADCLAPEQVAALERSLAGPRDAGGRALYADWPWDGGVGSDGWRLWKLGSERLPALNVLTGAPALAMIFGTPPVPMRSDPVSGLAWQMAADLGEQWRRALATGGDFARSAWADNAARSTDLDAFRARGGRMIVPHGASDPVFSINDTLAWYGAVEARTGRRAASFVRVFAVPGMAHCGGGPATDRFDAFAALVEWVEHGRAPASIAASAGPETPWPGRTRPLCAWPQVATYRGHGSVEDAASFICSR